MPVGVRHRIVNPLKHDRSGHSLPCSCQNEPFLALRMPAEIVGARWPYSGGAAGLGQRKAQVNRTAKCLSERERENFNQAVFALAFFAQRQDREMTGAI